MNLLTLVDLLIGQFFNFADHLMLRKDFMNRKSLRALSLTRHSRSLDDGVFLEAEKLITVFLIGLFSTTSLAHCLCASLKQVLRTDTSSMSTSHQSDVSLALSSQAEAKPVLKEQISLI
jgi:hypothetical protein